MATSVKPDDDLKSRIQQLTDTRQRSAHWIMREAIRDYVERGLYPHYLGSDVMQETMNAGKRLSGCWVNP